MRRKKTDATEGMLKLADDSIMITGFVAGMMLLIESLNVISGGRWGERLARGRFSQYLLAGLLGAMPGCLGAFTAVTLYSHGVISFGAVVAAMAASSGDEAFVMLALIPKTAAALAAVMLPLALAAGFFVDFISRRWAIQWPRCDALVIHAGEKIPWPSPASIAEQWRNCSPARGILCLALALFAAAIAAGQAGPEEWNWLRISLLCVSAAALLVVATAPDHFLEEHLWRHVALRHAPRVFLWSFGALAASEHLVKLFAIGGSGHEGRWLLLLTACGAGLIPESGPHLVFVTLYARHSLPFGVLLANSIVQDGHGMLPMLAHSRRAFIAVKAANLALGFAAGAAALLFDL